MMKLLNLGCGDRFCTDLCWTNVDFVSCSDRVIVHNLLQGIPFENESFDVVYHSNVLEHFNRPDGSKFIRECFRVLKPGGVLRVVVPDLEQICRLYLRALDKVETGNSDWQGRYDWMMLEMYDQTVRTTSGGEMAEYLRQLKPQDQEFVISRAGSVGRDAVNSVANSHLRVNQSASHMAVDWKRKLKKVPIKIAQKSRGLGRAMALRCLSKHEREALAIGLFRTGGEVHQWMYDRCSLSALLQVSRFKDVRQFNATSSQIADWDKYSLDIDPDGFEHASSCLFMEGVKA